MPDSLAIRVEDIQPGDRFVSKGRLYWTAIGPPEQKDAGSTPIVYIPIQWADGGRDIRTWDTGTEIVIERHHDAWLMEGESFSEMRGQ